MHLREEADAPPPLYGVSSLGASDQKAVEEDRKGLPLGASKGAVSKVSSGRDKVDEGRDDGEGPGSEGEEGGPGPS